MKIERHPIDDALAKELFERALKSLPTFIAGARRDPKNLSLLIDQAFTIVSCGCVVAPDSAELARALQLGAQAAAALFASVATPSRANAVQLGDGPSIAYSTAPDAGAVTVYEWILGFYLNVLIRDLAAVDMLCSVSSDALRGSPTGNPQYRYPYMEALRNFRTEQADVVPLIITAVEATDPARPDVRDRDWTLFLDVPQFEVFTYMAAHKQEQFTTAMIKALESHKKYWSAKKANRWRDKRGLISIPLTALAALAIEQKLAVDVESPYLALHLARF